MTDNELIRAQIAHGTIAAHYDGREAITIRHDHGGYAVHSGAQEFADDNASQYTILWATWPSPGYKWHATEEAARADYVARIPGATR